MSTSNTEPFIEQSSDTQDNPLPHRVSLALIEFCRLAEEATNYLSKGNLFPGLSSLTGLTPVLGTLKDYCIARVVPNDDTDETEKALPNKALAASHPGIYL